MPSTRGRNRDSGNPDMLSTNSETPKHCARTRKGAALGPPRRRGRPPKYTPYPIASSASDPGHTLSPTPQQRRMLPTRAPIMETITQWNTARWRQLTMTIGKLKRENGGCVDKEELSRQIEAWEVRVPKPEKVGDRVFLTKEPMPTKVSENRSVRRTSSPLQAESILADVSEPLGSVAPLDGEIYRELVDWLLANSPPAPPINWHEQYNDLFASVEDAGNYTNFGALPQRYEGLFCSERQSSLLTTEHGVSMLPGNIDERGRHLYPPS